MMKELKAGLLTKVPQLNTWGYVEWVRDSQRKHTTEMAISSFFMCAIKKAEINTWTNFINHVSNLFYVMLHFQLVLMLNAM